MRKKTVKVKICGITNWRDARCACDAGADFLGFNFYRRSPRYIDPSCARAIVQRLPGNVAGAGVFVNEAEDDIVRIARLVGLKYVQLHGEEAPAAVSRLRRALPAVRIIKAIRVRKTLRAGQIRRFHDASAILLDGFNASLRGGTGKTFDWLLAAGTSARARIFLAGGLTPENVAEAVRAVRPFAVDVCSGVESSPGKKDRRKVRALMRAVNGAQSTGTKR
jgi:phosphoribosylanthranilate isomerase